MEGVGLSVPCIFTKKQDTAFVGSFLAERRIERCGKFVFCGLGGGWQISPPKNEMAMKIRNGMYILISNVITIFLPQTL